jgi:hypothetical protein
MALSKTDVSAALFPVDLKPIYLEKAVGQLRLFEPSKEQKAEKQIAKHVRHLAIPGFRAVVARDNKHVFSVVTEKYRLVKNEEALELGKQCFQQIFKLTSLKDMECYNIIMPGTRSFCHIDLVHKGRTFSINAQHDTWSPYLRVTNSYNRMYALSFKIGFCRWICQNGMIFGGKSIDFKFHHSRRVNQAEAAFNLREGEFVSLEKRFVESLNNLSRYHVPPEMMWALTCKVFKISLPEEGRNHQEELYKMKKHHVEQLSVKYFQELGQNGYAALSILTDFATRPVGYISSEQQVDVLQSKTGEWVDDFVKSIADRSFSYKNYLGDYIRHAA